MEPTCSCREPPCQVKVIDSVIDIVKAGAARGLPMAVASGGTRKHVMEGLTSTGLLPYFKVWHRQHDS